MFRFGTILFTLITAVIGFALFLPVVHSNKGVVFYVPPGATTKQVVTALSDQGLLPFPIVFSAFVYVQPNKLKKGEYLFPQWATPFSIWKQVTQGKGYLYRSFTIVPGWTFQQLMLELSKALGLKNLSKNYPGNKVMLLINGTEDSPEGQFLPETYHYTYGISDLVILKRAYDAMQLKLKEGWALRAAGLPYKTPYEVLIAASIIEKEAFFAEERSVIAGVLINRLRKDMLLQFDPTVIYGLKDRYHGKISKENLMDNNAYNTYIHKGLPPTPIAMPGLQAIEAVLHPREHRYLYFVAKGDGSHQFSVSLLEHHHAVKDLVTKKHEIFNVSRVKQYLNSYIKQR